MSLWASTTMAQTTQPIVAIHDSELTRALETMPASGSTPTVPGTTGFEWWTSDWHYFVMPESVKEALRSDGTAFTVIGDSDVTAGLLLSNGAPRYPIVVSLASEAIRDDEVAQLTNYVAAGGFLLVGSSSFTRNPDGTTRGDFAFANELGIHMVNPNLLNWTYNNTLTRQSNHRLVSHIPGGQLTWRMPTYAEETPWGMSPSHQFLAPHDLWQVQPADATVLAVGDARPYLTVKPYGKGYFIYHAGMQPLVGHGGFAPGMYAYVIFRRAIEWAFESSRLPVLKLSPWPYQYDAAFMVRHDLENFQASIANVEASALVEFINGVKGDYYFCTGTLREDMGLAGYDTNAVIEGLRRAVVNYGATIGPHNGGLPNPYNANLTNLDYDFWHWGPDEVLDVNPPGYANGKAYALASLSNSFSDVESWLPGLSSPDMRMWVAPYFNATREDSYDIQAQLGVKIAGEQKLTPFPHWTLSTRTPGRRYPMLTEPASDWFVGGLVAQSLEPWQPPGVQNSATMRAGVDFYYQLGALINFYSHTLSTGQGDARQLVPEYIAYCVDTNLHPRMWAANGIDIYNWWVQRAPAQISPVCDRNGDQVVASIPVQGATHAGTALELQLPAAVRNLQVSADNTVVDPGNYRVNGCMLKILVGSSVTNPVVSYMLPPSAQSDFFLSQQNTPLAVPAPGVLANDTTGVSGGGLSASLASAPQHGTLSLNADGSFNYTPATGFTGLDSFTYKANDGAEDSDAAAVDVLVTSPGVLFADDFGDGNAARTLFPWIAQQGAWSVGSGRLVGSTDAGSYGNAYFDAPGWTNYTVEAHVRFSSPNALGGGIGGRLNPATGAHYAAWMYPEGSAAGPAVLRLIKFAGWRSWSGTPMQAVNLTNVGTNFHTVALAFSGPNIKVFYDGAQQMDVNDNNSDGVAPYMNGGISADIFADTNPFNLEVEDVRVTVPAPIAPPAIVTQPASRTNLVGTTAAFSVVATGQGLNYQWRFNGTNIPGATASNYARQNVKLSDAGNYTVAISNFAGGVLSVPAKLTVVQPVPPSIVKQPKTQTVIAGQTVTLSVGVTGTDPLKYKWYYNSVAIAGATGSNYVINNVQPANNGSYSVVVTNDYGRATSTVAKLTVNYSLTLQKNGKGTVSAVPAQASYAPGTVVIVTEIPGPGFAFTGWSGNASGIINPVIITMNSNKVVTATFRNLKSAAFK